MNHASPISGRLTRLLLLVLLLLTFGSAQALADTAQSGPTFTVNTTADVVDGTCGVDHCSLREALLAANHNNDANIIVLPPGTYRLSLTGSGEDFAERGDLDISADVTISGSSAAETIIDAGGPGGLGERVFQVLSGKVQISDVTITGGAPLSGEKEGAGIKHTGHKLTLNRVVLAGNVTDDNGGGLWFVGTDVLTIIDSTFRDNQASKGGGLYLQDTVAKSISGTTFARNRATNGNGGGIFNDAHVPLSIVNSTFSANTATGNGGAIHQRGDQVDLVNVTVADNAATAGGGLHRAEGKLNVTNTLLANNTGGNCAGSITSKGGNLSRDNSCPFSAASDQNGVDPLLDPLADNGGPTETHALRPGSPAIDTARADRCPSTDQRGVARPQLNGCDIGAFELDILIQTGPIFIVNTAEDGDDGLCTFDHCTLREAILAANARPNDATPDEIRFDIPAGGPQTISLASALPDLTDGVIIDGPTQPGGTITLAGNQAGAGVSGLTINTSQSSIRGMIITGFSGDGIRVLSGSGNSFLGNSIANNGGLAIDLNDDGPTANDSGDADLGANNFQNFPVIARAIGAGSQTIMQGRLNGPANTNFSIEFFVNDSCDGSNFGEAQTFLGSISTQTNASGNANFETSLNISLPEDRFISATATGPDGTSELAQCVPVSPGNDAWIRALPLTSGQTTGHFIDKMGQSRWYRIPVQPGSAVRINLTNLPANYDLTVYKDIAAGIEPVDSGADLNKLNAEFAPDIFSPDIYSPDIYSPDIYSPDIYSPDIYSPDIYSPDIYSPDIFSPDIYSPDIYSPDIYSPDIYSPDIYSPDIYSPDIYSPDIYSPDIFSNDPDTFTSAQLRSLIGGSGRDGLSDEVVIVNTWSNRGDFYMRVRGRNGAYSLAAPFSLQATVLPGACANVTADLGNTSIAGTAGGYRTLVLADLSRLSGTPEQIAALETQLATFLARPEVNGVRVNVNTDVRVAAANAQADANPDCPEAKNLVAEAIKSIIQNYRDLNDELTYIVILGNDAAIPFYRHPDQALLANEMNFVPPVRNGTPSQSSLRFGYVLGQDFYGASVGLSMKSTAFPLPDLAVGRLVETATDINGMFEAYLSTSGGVAPTPTTSLVTGYDFLEDAARAVQSQLEAGTGQAAETLITPRNVSPLDPALNQAGGRVVWNATDLSNALLGRRHDLIFLAGHFSAFSTLAADYQTRLLTQAVADSTVDLTNSLIFSAGCHAAYNTVDQDGITDVTVQPDWAQAFARRRATLIAGTGYQYGDTDFLKYGERLYEHFARQLRAGNGPVAIGQALIEAKRAYLAETPKLSGIDEKSLLQTTLFGFPMLSINMPAGRGPITDPGSIVSGDPTLFSANPGLTLGLRFADVSVTPALNQETATLTNANQTQTFEATYFSGSNGVLTRPSEPALPLEIRNVGVPGRVLRGVGFRGGQFSDLNDVIPFTGAPVTESRGGHTGFLTDILFPVQLWQLNFFDALMGGAPQLLLTPAQVRSTNLGSQTVTMRTFSRMDFRLYYNENTTTYPDSGNTPALTTPPSIAHVMATSNGDNLNFAVQVTGEPAAGIQEVWVTYTALSGPFAGNWQSLYLTQDTSDTTMWRGTLSLGGTNPADLRYMVQAVNGVGLVALATNLGAYYTPNVDPGMSNPNAQPTSLDLTASASSGPYSTSINVSAVLTSNGNGVGNRLITFALGGQQRRVLTNGSGQASTSLQLLGLPGSYEITANFAGDAGLASAKDTTGLTITKQATQLTLHPSETSGDPADLALMVATLEDANGKPLREKTVFFILTGDNGSASLPVITNFAGQAALGELNLPAGTYHVAAYFSGEIPMANGQTVNLPDVRYLPSSANGTLALVTGVCTNILDDFNRSTSLGPLWAGARATGNYKIVNNQVEVRSGGAAYWKDPAFGSDQTACLTMIRVNPHGYHGLLLKVQDRNWQKGAISVFYDGADQVVGVEIYRPHQDWATIATFPYQLQNGDQFAAQALANGAVRIYVNDELVGETAAIPFFANKGGYLGIWFIDAGNPRAIFDDFGGQ